MNQKDFVNELPELVPDYDKSLNEFTNEINAEVENYEKDFINKDKNLNLFKLDNEKIDLSEKEKLISLLYAKRSKNTFNKISYLNIAEILNQKYKLNNQTISINNEFKDPFKDFKNQKKDDGKKIAYWRESLGDGNSFYRMFMFSLMEQFIFKKDFMELAKLFKKIEKDFKEISIFNNNFKVECKLVMERIFKNIDIQKVLIIFNEILNYLKKDNCKKAYSIMIKAFNLEDESFDKVNFKLIFQIMIEYLRINVYKELIKIKNFGNKSKN